MYTLTTPYALGLQSYSDIESGRSCLLYHRGNRSVSALHSGDMLASPVMQTRNGGFTELVSPPLIESQRASRLVPCHSGAPIACSNAINVLLITPTSSCQDDLLHSAVLALYCDFLVLCALALQPDVAICVDEIGGVHQWWPSVLVTRTRLS
jgi:hypothetical protein